jgi:hypothetical protein
MKKLFCALMVLTAVPALAQEQEEEVRVLVRGRDPMPPLPPLPPSPPHVSLAPPSYGIPPHLVEKLGLPENLVRKVQDMTFEANEALIGLEADLKRAQLALERELRQPSPNEASVMQLAEKVGQAETAVRKNRLGLMVSIKKLLGPETWRKLEAELGPIGGMGFPHRVRIQRRIELPDSERKDAPRSK